MLTHKPNQKDYTDLNDYGEDLEDWEESCIEDVENFGIISVGKDLPNAFNINIENLKDYLFLIKYTKIIYIYRNIEYTLLNKLLDICNEYNIIINNFY